MNLGSISRNELDGKLISWKLAENELWVKIKCFNPIAKYCVGCKPIHSPLKPYR